VSPVRYKLGFYIPEDGILHSHRLENLKSYEVESLRKLAVVLLDGHQLGNTKENHERTQSHQIGRFTARDTKRVHTG
jgi:hypothetical protein